MAELKAEQSVRACFKFSLVADAPHRRRRRRRVLGLHLWRACTGVRAFDSVRSSSDIKTDRSKAEKRKQKLFFAAVAKVFDRMQILV